MKKIVTILCFLGFSSSSFAAPSLDLNNFTCTGQAEYNRITVQNLTRKGALITFTYSEKGKRYAKSYTVTDFKKNGYTDAHSQAYFIGATASGRNDDRDDISIQQMGTWKNGVGSTFSFTHAGVFAVGILNCK